MGQNDWAVHRDRLIVFFKLPLIKLPPLLKLETTLKACWSTSCWPWQLFLYQHLICVNNACDRVAPKERKRPFSDHWSKSKLAVVSKSFAIEKLLQPLNSYSDGSRSKIRTERERKSVRFENQFDREPYRTELPKSAREKLFFNVLRAL